MRQTTPIRGRAWPYILLLVLVAAATAGVTALLLNVSERKAEGREPFVRLVEVDEDTTDPAVWGVNWPKQYETYLLTAESTRTRFGAGHGWANQAGLRARLQVLIKSVCQHWQPPKPHPYTPSDSGSGHRCGLATKDREGRENRL